MSSTWWGSSSHVRARYSWPPSAKWRKKTGVVEVDRLQFVEAQILRPGPVVERLGDDVPRSAVTLEFEDVDASLGIEGEEVDESPEPGGHLPADDEQIGWPKAHARRSVSTGNTSDPLLDDLFLRKVGAAPCDLDAHD